MCVCVCMSHSRKDVTRRDVSRRTALRTIAVGGIGSIALGGTSAANPGGKCDAVVPDEYTSIQAAVDAADDGDTVCVEDGTYAEQVVVNKSLTLQNADGASPTVELTDSPESFTIAESGPTWEPMVFAFGGSESDGDVSGSGTVDVDVMGFTIDGGNEDPDARRKPAVLFRNASGDIADNTIESTNVGNGERQRGLRQPIQRRRCRRRRNSRLRERRRDRSEEHRRERRRRPLLRIVGVVS